MIQVNHSHTFGQIDWHANVDTINDNKDTYGHGAVGAAEQIPNHERDLDDHDWRVADVEARASVLEASAERELTPEQQHGERQADRVDEHDAAQQRQQRLVGH